MTKTDPNKKTIRRGRLMVILDRSKVIPDDPGADTPALVFCFGFCSTYWCAQGEGELLNSDGRTLQLTQDEINWLGEIDGEVTEFLYRSENSR